MSIKDRTDFSPNYHMWHRVTIRIYQNGSYNSQLQFNIKLPHIKRMGRVKRVGNFYGFNIELHYKGREKDRILKKDKVIFIYPFENESQAGAELIEIKSMRKQCLSNRRNLINKRKLENQDVKQS